MKDSPLVTVVCLCYNHQDFVKDAILSILNQTYDQIEIIVYDDASTDQSVDVIKKIIVDHPTIKFMASANNMGNCKAFNRALEKASGEFIIDLAADDMLESERVKIGVEALLDPKYGVHFCESTHIDKEGKIISQSPSRVTKRNGNLYIDLIRYYFIDPASMMFRTSLLKDLNGYDESLHYEDFDIWIRTSRVTEYAYSDLTLVTKRILQHSLSREQFKISNSHQESTLRVCEKIHDLNKSPEEDEALRFRLRYEIKSSIKMLNWNNAMQFGKLYRKSFRHS